MLKLLKKFWSTDKQLSQNYLRIDGWLTPAEAQGLFKIAASLPSPAVVVEIGSWKGKSTYCIAQGLKKGVINCIDPFNAAGEEGSKQIYEETKGNKSLLEQFEANVANANSAIKINTLKGYSKDFVGKIKSIDFLFIDGDHSIEGCQFDFQFYEKDLKLGGIVAFHDYYPDRNDLGPTWVIKNMVQNNPNYQFLEGFDSLYTFKKLSANQQ
jgi:MMP 1-O-methyltransferase